VNDNQRLRYSRHLLLQGWSEATQERLLASHALVVGVGGLGSPAAMYLAAAGVGHITLIDPDRVELSNLQRQIAHRSDAVGKPKSDSAASSLRALNPDVQVHAVTQALDDVWLHHWLQQVQASPAVVLDCTDRWATRQAINQACWSARVPLVSASALQWDAQLSTFDPRRSDSPCYACYMPPDQAVQDLPCATLGVFAPLVGMAGVMQAGEALKCLASDATEVFDLPDAIAPSLIGKLHLIDGRTWQHHQLTLSKHPACVVCGSHAP